VYRVYDQENLKVRSVEQKKIARRQGIPQVEWFPTLADAREKLAQWRVTITIAGRTVRWTIKRPQCLRCEPNALLPF
jgi:hypothetical protein